MLLLGGACYETHPRPLRIRGAAAPRDAQVSDGPDAQSVLDAGDVDSDWLDASPLDGSGLDADIAHDAGLAPCEDGIACTLDLRDASGRCTHVPDDGQCVDGFACTADRCDPARGCVRVEDHALCDDGFDCTADTCHAGFGCTHAPDDAQCADGIDCTIDDCRVGRGCVHEADDAQCDDDVACTEDACDAARGCTYAPDDTQCDDGVDCTLDVCDAALGCGPLPDHALCAAPECGTSQCSASVGCYVEPLDTDCDDGFACTIDSCLPDGRCEHIASDALCGEGETCRTDCGGCILDVAPKGYILAHSDWELFRVRPEDGHTIDVADFSAGPITDIAVDDRGRLWGISFGAVFRVDFCSGVLEYITSVPSSINGMTWAPDGSLYATALDGTVYRVNPDNGEVTAIGTLQPWGSSGDVVYTHEGTLLVTSPGNENGDQLLSFDLTTGVMTVVGSTGYFALYGLALFDGRLIAGDSAGQLFELDRSTGAGTLLSLAPYSIWGAAARPDQEASIE